jgi:hypothetical protein
MTSPAQHFINGRMTRALLLWVAAGGAWVLSGCAVVGNVTELDDAYYRVVRRSIPAVPAAPGQRLYVASAATPSC